MASCHSHALKSTKRVDEKILEKHQDENTKENTKQRSASNRREHRGQADHTLQAINTICFLVEIKRWQS